MHSVFNIPGGRLKSSDLLKKSNGNNSHLIAAEFFDAPLVVSGTAASVFTFSTVAVLIGKSVFIGASSLIFTPSAQLTGKAVGAGSSAVQFVATGLIENTYTGSAIFSPGSSAVQFVATGLSKGKTIGAGSSAVQFITTGLSTGKIVCSGSLSIEFIGTGILWVKAKPKVIGLVSEVISSVVVSSKIESIASFVSKVEIISLNKSAVYIKPGSSSLIQTNIQHVSAVI